ncbi:MAG: endonuclease III [bacterium]
MATQGTDPRRDLARIVRALRAGYGRSDAPVKRMPGRGAFRILVATVLSTRTQDPVTAAAAARLLAIAPDPVALARLTHRRCERIIYPVGFYRTKARMLADLARVLVERGGVPDTIEGLLELPGVGRKVANIVLAKAFGQAAIAVDTHVHRISNRLGLVRTDSPAATERRLAAVLPREYWRGWNELLVAHGQTVCRPVRPRCDECGVSRWCRQVGVRRTTPAGGRRQDRTRATPSR